jgi:hypothetical protein
MRLADSLLILSVACPLAFADVSFTAPIASEQVPGGAAYTVTWADSAIAPSISALSVYDLVLYSGSNAAPVSVLPHSSFSVKTTSNYLI